MAVEEDVGRVPSVVGSSLKIDQKKERVPTEAEEFKGPSKGRE